MSSEESRVMELAREMGVFRARDASSRGISRVILSRLVENEKLERIAQGTYRVADDEIDERFALAVVSRKIDDCVICLTSALSFHEMTTQLPSRVWLGIVSGRVPPKLTYPKIRVVSMSEESLSYGVEKHEIEKVPVAITSPAKTVADCFKYRNKVGLDVALEALREYWHKRRGSLEELFQAAEVCRVAKIIRPYLEATIG